MVSMKNESLLNTVEKKEQPVPAFLTKDYPYQAVGMEFTDIEMLIPEVVYEIKCSACETAIRAQGKKLSTKYNLMKDSGCMCCGNKALVVKRVDMSLAPLK